MHVCMHVCLYVCNVVYCNAMYCKCSVCHVGTNVFMFVGMYLCRYV